MSKLILDASVSLDGFSSGPGVDKAHPMGEGGACLHDWLSGSDGHAVSEADRQIGGALFASCGAVLMGRRTFDVGVDLWGEDAAFRMPCFVLTHRARAPLVKGPTTFTFVTEGVVAAAQRARAAAGAKHVWVMGSAGMAQQCLHEGLVDELRLHLIPVMLGAGTRLFGNADRRALKLERTSLIASPLATHLSLRVRP